MADFLLFSYVSFCPCISNFDIGVTWECCVILSHGFGESDHSGGFRSFRVKVEDEDKDGMRMREKSRVGPSSEAFPKSGNTCLGALPAITYFSWLQL